jgi:hypothetical protein
MKATINDNQLSPPPEFNLECYLGFCAPFFDISPSKEGEGEEIDNNFLFQTMTPST